MRSTSPAREMTASGAVRHPAKQSLPDRYRAVRQRTLRTCAPLTVEDHSLQSMADASPAKWHLAHTTWFFETFVLGDNLPGYREFHPAFRRLFNSYYNAVGDRPLRALRHILSRPVLEDVHAYRDHVDAAIDRLFGMDLPSSVQDLIVLGLNHEQQHQELILTDAKNGLWTSPLRPAYRVPARKRAEPNRATPAFGWQGFPDGLYDIGFQGGGFAFDNEGPLHKVYLDSFRLASRLVTNAEYIDFMRDGGYTTPGLWLSDGWDCALNNQWNAPLYWEQRDGEWWSYTIEGMKPVAPDEPVCHVSYYEADAFAHWAGARLATEFEWESAANTCELRGNLLESEAVHPQPSASTEPLTQMFGDVWEWTASAYTPYPNYRPAAGAIGEYNGKFMCNQMVLRGGSCATPLSHIRATYRNFFPPHARWQFMGIRLANGN